MWSPQAPCTRKWGHMRTTWTLVNVDIVYKLLGSDTMDCGIYNRRGKEKCRWPVTNTEVTIHYSIEVVRYCTFACISMAKWSCLNCPEARDQKSFSLGMLGPWVMTSKHAYQGCCRAPRWCCTMQQ